MIGRKERFLSGLQLYLQFSIFLDLDVCFYVCSGVSFGLVWGIGVFLVVCWGVGFLPVGCSVVCGARGSIASMGCLPRPMRYACVKLLRRQFGFHFL